MSEAVAPPARRPLEAPGASTPADRDPRPRPRRCSSSCGPRTRRGRRRPRPLRDGGRSRSSATSSSTPTSSTDAAGRRRPARRSARRPHADEVVARSATTACPTALDLEHRRHARRGRRVRSRAGAGRRGGRRPVLRARRRTQPLALSCRRSRTDRSAGVLGRPCRVLVLALLALARPVARPRSPTTARVRPVPRRPGARGSGPASTHDDGPLDYAERLGADPVALHVPVDYPLTERGRRPAAAFAGEAATQGAVAGAPGGAARCPRRADRGRRGRLGACWPRLHRELDTSRWSASPRR